MTRPAPFPIGTSGVPWGPQQREQWRGQQQPRRSYADEVVRRIDGLRDRYEVVRYGTLPAISDAHPLYALRSPSWSDRRPAVLVTGGVHGYETSGVMGALEFAEQYDWTGEFDLLIAPCVSPWAYERIHRWNSGAHDPNRSFVEGTPVEECAALMSLVAPIRERVLLHIDLHETTDSDETEFRPALAARDGIVFEAGEIPDGFYLCGDTEAPELEFQTAVLDAVAAVTHIAPADASGQIIGTDIAAPGLILYPMSKLGLSVSITPARFRTLTEVYPDSARTTPAECNAAQVVAVRAAISFALDATRLG